MATIFFSGAEIRTIGSLGTLATGLPQLQLPIFTFREFNEMFVDAIVLAMLGCIDALLTSVVADSLTRTQHNSDKELIGQGLGNLFSGLFGGLPGAGATMGTVVNINTGARTALSGLTRALILLVVVLFASGITEVFPWRFWPVLPCRSVLKLLTGASSSALIKFPSRGQRSCTGLSV